MRALTIWQPWAACIAYNQKPVENRRRRPPVKWGLPFEMAIHAAVRRRVRDEAKELEAIRSIWPGVDASWVTFHRGSVIAVVDVVGFRAPRHGHEWEAGPVCWELENTRTLAKPVPCRGQQGPWTLPPDVEAEVRLQLEAA